MIRISYHKNRHYPALIFAAMLLVLVVVFFLTFAFGAYMTFNHPISNVVAETRQASTGGYYLALQATGFQNNTQKLIWIDPQFSPNNSSLVSPSSGCIAGHAVTDSSGSIFENFTVSNACLNAVSSDGQHLHSVWVIGIAQSNASPAPYSQLITFDSQQNYTVATRGSGIILFVTLIVFELPVNFNLGQLFLFLWIIFVLMFAVALNGPARSVVGAIRESSRRGVSAIFDNSLLGMLAVFSVVLWGTILLELVQAAGGVSTGSLPPTDPLLQYVELSIAPLREEIGFRVIPIGVAAFLIVVAKGRWKDGVMALWHPSKYLKKVDSPLQYKKHLQVMYVLIAISSLLFGLAHVLLGAGWGVGKISEAAGAGVALGALYLKYGFPAAVLLHWSIDVALQTVAINDTLATYSVWIIFYTGALAVVSTIVLSLLLVRRLRRRPPLLYPATLKQ